MTDGPFHSPSKTLDDVRGAPHFGRGGLVVSPDRDPGDRDAGGSGDRDPNAVAEGSRDGVVGVDRPQILAELVPDLAGGIAEADADQVGVMPTSALHSLRREPHGRHS